MSYEFVVYLDMGGHSEPLSQGYISRDRANQVAETLGETFPANRYFVSRRMVRDDNGRSH